MSEANIATLKMAISSWTKVEELYNFLYEIQQGVADQPIIEILVPAGGQTRRVGVDTALLPGDDSVALVDILVRHAEKEYRRLLGDVAATAKEAHEAVK